MNDLQPIVSIIIPCFNHGIFLDEAIESVCQIRDVKYEIIIVNDGSTDSFTLSKFKEFEQRGIEVLHQQNKGLGAARNAGIYASKGKYILPLDSDNKIKPEYIYKSLPILENAIADIVYAKPIFIGENIETRKFKTFAFDPFKMLEGNFVDACAVFNKRIWDKTGGFDTNMPVQGNEDWDFWLTSIAVNAKFYFLDEQLFYYRIIRNSMIENATSEANHEMLKSYIYSKHYKLFETYIIHLKELEKRIQFEEAHPLRTAIKYSLKLLKLL
ncbi:MAG: glycosyltransferase [Bacteroidota bacterium]|nr:glycosyltransferase [Bacteroidota bacterium]